MTTLLHRLGLSTLVLSAALLVGCDRPTYVDLSPSNLELERRNDSRRVTGRAMNQQGRYFPDVMFEWSSEDPSVAIVDELGNVSAVSSGRTSVVARYRDLEARSRVTVTLVESLRIEEPELTLRHGSRRRYTPAITPLDSLGRPLPDRRVTIRSADESVVIVHPRGGLLPVNPGETKVIAEVDGLTGIVNVTVAR